MSESTDISEVVGPTPHLEQVDPPHPFKAILKALVIAANNDGADAIQTLVMSGFHPALSEVKSA